MNVVFTLRVVRQILKLIYLTLTLGRSSKVRLGWVDIG